MAYKYKTPEELHIIYLKELKKLIKDVENGRLLITELKHEIEVEEHGGLMVGDAIYTGQEWINITLQKVSKNESS